MTGGPRLSQQPFTEAVQLHQAEHAWKPSMKRLAEGSRDRREEDPEKARTQDLYRKMRSILNKLTPEVFPQLVKQINVPSKESPGVAINFRLVLLKLCQVEFQKLGEGTLANSVNGHRQRSVGNIRLIGELFKLEMLKVTVIHSCISKLLYNKSEDALECLCCLLSTVGQKLDSDKNNWFCRRGEPGPKTIRQVRRQAEMERQWEKSLVQEFNSKTDNWCHGGNDLRVHEEPHPAWRRSCLLTEKRPNSEKGWKPELKRLTEGGRDRREKDPEAARTQELYKNMCSVLDKLTPEIFRHLMEEVNEFPINTEERLRGITALIFEKAISEEGFAATCAKMCHCLREMEEGQHQRSIGNMRFIGELFKLRMVKESVMHNCINKLLITQSDVALESLCCLLSIIGKILDCDEQHLMGEYVHQMEEILNRRKVSSQVSFLLQDIVDLRKNYWFPIKAQQGYRPICQLSTEATMENMQERIEEQQQLVPSSDCNRPGRQHLALWQSIQLQDEGQNTAISPANNDLEPYHRIFMQSSTEQIDTLDSNIRISVSRQEGNWRGHRMEQELGCLSSSTLNLIPTLLLSSPFTCSLNMLFDRTNWIQNSAEVFYQFNLAESLGRSSDYSNLEVLGPETHALLTLPALPAPVNPAGAMNTSSNPAPALLATTENELERVAKPTEMKVKLGFSWAILWPCGWMGIVLTGAPSPENVELNVANNGGT
ncbi:hypothetical protein SKAU_G00289450 [Synaphobranchus kaupii]|uniref:MIF4G domain-containing protein n=1 Tax=Synaphobranchus kaupii TaxID=118154 RepID=A0A9Q1ETF1_SYNKA|nr:hypothetical protein SKAU_G00289450 [Synaphobranchus kaupii]